jgi:hypothetical protein
MLLHTLALIPPLSHRGFLSCPFTGSAGARSFCPGTGRRSRAGRHARRPAPRAVARTPAGACTQQAVCASGHAMLDAQLPGGGWPVGTLTELLLPHAGLGELRLLAPALAALQRQQRCLMWLDPPSHALRLKRWLALGLDVQRLVLVTSPPAHQGPRTRKAARSRHPLGAGKRAQERPPGRRAGLAAGAAAGRRAAPPAAGRAGHEGPAFLLRDASRNVQRASAAPLRLLLTSAGADQPARGAAQAPRPAAGHAADLGAGAGAVAARIGACAAGVCCGVHRRVLRQHLPHRGHFCRLFCKPHPEPEHDNPPHRHGQL